MISLHRPAEGRAIFNVFTCEKGGRRALEEATPQAGKKERQVSQGEARREEGQESGSLIATIRHSGCNARRPRYRMGT
jgi:hypothetical protein